MKLIMNLQRTPPFSFFSPKNNNKRRRNKGNNDMPSSLTSARADQTSFGSVGGVGEPTAQQPAERVMLVSIHQFNHVGKTLNKGQPHGSTAPTRSSSDRCGAMRITRSELETVLRRLGPQPPTDDEVAAMLAEASHRAGRDRSFRMEEILSLCGGDDEDDGMAAKAIAAAEEQEDELKETFAVFDANGDGRISAEELHALLGQEGCTLDDCRQMIVGVDIDGDGFVCFEEFTRMMTMDTRRCGPVIPAAAAAAFC